MNLKFWQKRSLENPETPLASPSDWLVSGLSNGATLSPDQALGLTPVYNAITLISETVAQLPLSLYERNGEDTNRARDNDLNDLVGVQPYKHYGSFHWRQVQQAHALGWGNGYAHIERNARGSSVGIRLLDSSKTTAHLEEGRKFYVTMVNGKGFPIRYEDMLHIPAMAFDGLAGRSPITVAKDSVSGADAAQKFSKGFYANGSHWGSTLSIPDSFGSENFNAMQEAVKKYKGQGYSGTLVIPSSAELKALSMSPKDSQFIEGRQFSVLEVARIFNLPADFLSYLEKSSFNNTTEMSIRLVRYTLVPWLTKWENELNIKLLTKEQRKTLFFKFNTGGLLRGTLKERYEAYKTGIDSGVLVRNEARALEDLNQIDGLSEPLVPLNMVTQGQLDALKEEEKDDTRSIDVLAPQIRHTAKQFSTALEKINAKEPAKRAEELAGYVLRNIKPLIETIINLEGGDLESRLIDFGEWVDSQDNLDTETIFNKLTEVSP